MTTLATGADNLGLVHAHVAQPIGWICLIPGKLQSLFYLMLAQDYFVCACGHSGKLPFCDGTHKKVHEVPVVPEAVAKKPFFGGLTPLISRANTQIHRVPQSYLMAAAGLLVAAVSVAIVARRSK